MAVAAGDRSEDPRSRTPEGAGFLSEPAPDPAVDRMYADDVADHGHVMNLSHVWAHAPALHEAFFDLVSRAATGAGLDVRERAVLVVSVAATAGDPYCSLAWGRRLADRAGPEVAAALVRGDTSDLTPREQALAAWGRAVTADPAGTVPDQVDALRSAGFDDPAVVALTLFATLRRAFSTVNAALGARPDHALAERAPRALRDAVDFGRPVAGTAGT